jgi:hypothetical protein
MYGDSGAGTITLQHGHTGGKPTGESRINCSAIFPLKFSLMCVADSPPQGGEFAVEGEPSSIFA